MNPVVAVDNLDHRLSKVSSILWTWYQIWFARSMHINGTSETNERNRRLIIIRSINDCVLGSSYRDLSLTSWKEFQASKLAAFEVLHMR